MGLVFLWIEHYGYAGLFGLLVLGIVGVPVPDETLLVFSGYLVSQGKLHLVLVFLAAFAGSACGISLSYYLGETLGFHFVRRFGRYVHLTEERVALVNRWFHHAGNWVLMFGYFVPGVRHVTAFAAGMARLEYRIFAGHAYLGAAIWVAGFLTLGYFVGDQWQVVFHIVEHYILWISVAVAVIILIAWRLKRRRARR
ncbi:MAG TPA: DedA family protein [Bryobacteraceae bacterium]|jgi:membrane protein DedA with SNARE-associated domain|nr:DedA family protein [Bryobacteraceae bacterium]